jgi:hypothetical protein
VSDDAIQIFFKGRKSLKLENIYEERRQIKEQLKSTSKALDQLKSAEEKS